VVVEVHESHSAASLVERFRARISDEKAVLFSLYPVELKTLLCSPSAAFGLSDALG
jgi:hypothetical protein